MKATGIIRRIDDLGRIVVPKEIRKNLRIKQGENLEIFVNENENIILKKYNQIDKLKEISDILTKAVYDTTKQTIIITNTEIIISISGKNKKDYHEKELSEYAQDIIQKRKLIKENHSTKQIIKNQQKTLNYLINPIIINGDVTGSIIIISENDITQNDQLISNIISNILAFYIED